MTEYIIQPATNATAIIRVLHAAFQHYENDPMPSSALAETAESIATDLQSGIEIFGAYLHDELVGILKLTTKENALYFSRLSVPPSYQKRGIASTLVNYVSTLSQERAIPVIQCKVRKNEISNIRLYEKLGYTIISEEITMSPTGFPIETVTMEKRR